MSAGYTLPTALEIKTFSEQADLLAQPLYIMRSKPMDGLAAVMENLESHLAYWKINEENRILFAAGPVFPVDINDSWNGEGMVIFRAESLEEARHIADNDPMHVSGAREFRLEPWLLNHLIT